MSFTNGTAPNTSTRRIAQGANETNAGFYEAETMNFGDNGVLKINYDTNGVNEQRICK